MDKASETAKLSLRAAVFGVTGGREEQAEDLKLLEALTFALLYGLVLSVLRVLRRGGLSRKAPCSGVGGVSR